MNPNILNNTDTEEITMTLPSGFGHEDFAGEKPQLISKGNSVFARLILSAQQDFQEWLMQEIGILSETRKSIKWVPYKEFDFNKFIYKDYLESGDFIELSFWKNKYIRGLVEEVSLDGFFVILRVEVGFITSKEGQSVKNSFYGYTLLELPIVLWGDREFYFSAGKVKESKRDITAVTKRDLRDTMKEIENINHSVLPPQKYEEFLKMIQYFNALREGELTSIRCLIPENSERELKQIPLSIRERILSIFKRKQ